MYFNTNVVVHCVLYYCPACLYFYRLYVCVLLYCVCVMYVQVTVCEFMHVFCNLLFLRSGGQSSNSAAVLYKVYMLIELCACTNLQH